MDNFGKLEIKTKRELLENLKGRKIRVTRKIVAEDGLDQMEDKIISFDGRILKVGNLRSETNINLVGYRSGVFDIIELSSGKTVYKNSSVLKAYKNFATEENPINKEKILLKGHFYYGLDKQLD